ncbi:acyltransferase family protein [Salinisphaera aquimarina]|uniref:Acyltransferase family protein n=1 Tax=Salinisphaera aquimarina TaxID=2094031 RepID=A0ABV7ET33_9GAMM
MAISTPMTYRADIDGLRGVAVLAVVLFHSGFDCFSGGYVGVDVFFVISGYLITGVVATEVDAGTFSFASFYRRRVARLFPALIVTLIAVLVFGFFFYSADGFDYLGKSVFFSSFGAANLLYAQGVDYFAQDESVRPLIHLWSLGVEEQFYLLWPLLLVVSAQWAYRWRLCATLVILVASLLWAISNYALSPTETYFLPQFRAFELLIGAAVALIVNKGYAGNMLERSLVRNVVSSIGVGLVIFPMFVLSRDSVFPGVNALWPCFGAASLIMTSERSMIARMLGWRPLVLIGLISYPLYLYHEPVISALKYFDEEINSYVLLVSTLLISAPASWVTYKYLEQPIREGVRSRGQRRRVLLVALVSGLLVSAICGAVVAKTNGLADRFKVLNQFAYEVTQQGNSEFSHIFKRGIDVRAGADSEVLFFGDSVLQQYVIPISKALGVPLGRVDTITRGGCVLLKGAEFRDKFSDISCDSLRKELFSQKKHYRYVVFSQAWALYDGQVTNMREPSEDSPLYKWLPFIKATIDEFRRQGSKVIIIGAHPEIQGTKRLAPQLFLTRSDYRNGLATLRLANDKYLKASLPFFTEIASTEGVCALNPIEIWGEPEPTIHNGQWSFFKDRHHLTRSGAQYLTNSLSHMKFCDFSEK